jgi:hypothetical protein
MVKCYDEKVFSSLISTNGHIVGINVHYFNILSTRFIYQPYKKRKWYYVSYQIFGLKNCLLLLTLMNSPQGGQMIRSYPSHITAEQIIGNTPHQATDLNCFTRGWFKVVTRRVMKNSLV